MLMSKKLSAFVSAKTPATITFSIEELKAKLQKAEGIKILSQEELAGQGLYDYRGDTAFFVVKSTRSSPPSYTPARPRPLWEKVVDLVMDGTPFTLPQEGNAGLLSIDDSSTLRLSTDGFREKWTCVLKDGLAVFSPQNHYYRGWVYEALGIESVQVELPEKVVTLPKEPWREVWAVDAYNFHDETQTCFVSEVQGMVTPFLRQLQQLVGENLQDNLKMYAGVTEEINDDYLCPDCGNAMTTGIQNPNGDYDDWAVQAHCTRCDYVTSSGKHLYDDCIPVNFTEKTVKMGVFLGEVERMVAIQISSYHSLPTTGPGRMWKGFLHLCEVQGKPQESDNAFDERCRAAAIQVLRDNEWYKGEDDWVTRIDSEIWNHPNAMKF